MGLQFYGIGAAQVPDKAGEVIMIENIDTSNLAYINDEHSGDMWGFVGGITGHKKIFSEKDCETDNQRRCWKDVQKPFLYVEGQLADDQDHPNAQAAAALLKFTNAHRDLPLKVGLSVEGAILERSGHQEKVLQKTRATGVSLTVKPCNPYCKLYLKNDLVKSDFSILLPGKYEEVLKKSEGLTPSFKDTTEAKIYDKLQDLKKSLERWLGDVTIMKCYKCGDSQRMFKSSKDWPNVCNSCGHRFTMKQIYKALTKESGGL